MDLRRPARAWRVAGRPSRICSSPTRRSASPRARSAPTRSRCSYQIAPGYYLYRDKFKFAAAPAKRKLGAPRAARRASARRTSSSARSRPIAASSRSCCRSQRGAPVPRSTLRDLAGLRRRRRVLRAARAEGRAQARGRSRRDAARCAGASPPAGRRALRRPAGDDSRAIAAALRAAASGSPSLSFFGFGLLLSFTPCVLPMMPILSGIIVGRGHARHAHARLHARRRSYVLGMAVTYAAAGVLAGLSGAMLSAALQKPVGARGVRGGVRAARAGDVRLLRAAAAGRAADAARRREQPPARRPRRRRVRDGRALGADRRARAWRRRSPGRCSTSARAGDVVLGGSALFAMALGMGVPLLVGRRVRRRAAAEGRAVDGDGQALLRRAAARRSRSISSRRSCRSRSQMLAWAALLDRDRRSSCGRSIRCRRTRAASTGSRKGVGVHRAGRRRRFLVGALSGGRDILQPLAGLRGARRVAAGAAVDVHAGRASAELDARVAAAAGRPVMLDFYADWCVSCKEMERYTFSDARGAAAARRHRAAAGRRHREHAPSTRRCSSASACSARPASSSSTAKGARSRGCA